MFSGRALLCVLLLLSKDLLGNDVLDAGVAGGHAAACRQHRHGDVVRLDQARHKLKVI